MPNTEDFTGRDATLLVPQVNDTIEVAISNVSFDIEADQTEVQHNDDFNPTNVITGMSYSGSFEYQGANVELLDNMLVQNDDFGGVQRTSKKGTITIEEWGGLTFAQENGADREIIFQGVKFTSITRDIPGDDVASVSVDFVADNMRVVDGSNQV